jgi:hypothetical protein
MTDVDRIFSAIIFPVKPLGSNEFSGARFHFDRRPLPGGIARLDEAFPHWSGT